MSGSKLLRLCSLFLCLLLCLANFSVVANAAEAEENLVDGNLSNWVDCGESLDAFQTVDITSSNNNNIISVESNSKGMAIIYDLTEFLKIGESYQLSFTLPDTNSTGLNYYSLGWTLANSVDGPVAAESRELVYVKNSNKSDFLGKTITFEFTYTEGYKNTCLALYIWGNDGLTEFPSTNFYINDVSLTRVTTESEKKLDGILGWLEDIKNSITGLGDKLTSVWENITNSVSALGDRISGFFSDLGNTISTKFNELTDNFSNFITNLGDRISGFFDNLITNVKTFFEELPRKIFNYEIEVTDDDIISDGSGSDGEGSNDNILNLDSGWYGYVGNMGGMNYNCSVTNYDNYIYFEKPKYSYGRFYLDDVPLKANCSAVLTFTLFNLKENYSFNFNCSSDYFFESLGIIENSGTYTLEFPVVPVDSSFDIEISGYRHLYDELAYFSIKDCYITYVPIEDGSTGDTGSDEEGTTTKVSWFQYLINKFKSWFTSIIDSVKGFFIKLVDDIKGLFIPPDGFFEEWKVTFDLMLSDNLGFIYQAPNFVIDIVEVVQEILQSDQEVNLVFPAVEFDIAGYHIELFKDTKVDFSFLEAGIWLTLYSMYKVMLYVIFALALIKYGMSTWERTMAN